ncbi:aminotransferase [Halomonas denitrificans]|nr:aminotransferase class III-fold pyridoxal phosphate-dependent enzyme [Halomonas denitrificans]
MADSLEALDRRYLFHPSSDLRMVRDGEPLIWTRGQGIHVEDQHGQRYLEGMAGLWCTALGYGEKELAKAAAEQMETFCYGPLFAARANEPSIKLAAKLAEWVPIDGARFLFGCSGSDANDTQIKLARYYFNAIGKPHKKKILSRTSGYHGTTLATAALTGLGPFHAHFDVPGEDVVHLTEPHHFRQARDGESEEAFATRLAEELEQVIEREGADTIAAMIVEPLMGAGGLIIPPKTYYEKIQPILCEHGILLIDDEVVCAFGRTGNPFGCQTFGMQPATMTMAKALSSAYQPISAVAIPPFMYEAIERAAGEVGMFGHGLTYSGHPVAAAVALRTLELYEERGLMDHAARMGDAMQAKLAPLADHPLVGNLRGVGLIAGLEFVADKASGARFDASEKIAFQVQNACLEAGLVVRALPGDTCAICPPLIIDEAGIDELIEKLLRGLDAVQAKR